MLGVWPGRRVTTVGKETVQEKPGLLWNVPAVRSLSKIVHRKRHQHEHRGDMRRSRKMALTFKGTSSPPARGSKVSLVSDVTFDVVGTEGGWLIIK